MLVGPHDRIRRILYEVVCHFHHGLRREQGLSPCEIMGMEKRSLQVIVRKKRVDFFAVHR